MARDAAGVVIDTKEINRLADALQIGRGKLGPRRPEDLGQLRRVRAAQHRLQILAVHVRVGPPRGGEVAGILARGMLGLEVQHDADLVPALRAIRLHAGAVRAQQVVGHQRGLEQVAMSRRQRAVEVAAVGHHPGLVERRPQVDAVVERADDDARVVGEPVRDVGIEPAAAVVERGRKVPVVQRDGGLDAAGEQRVHEAVVEREPTRVHRPAALGQDAAPRDAEAVRVEPQVGEQRDVFGEAAVVIAGHVAGVAVGGEPRRVGEAVPDARPRAVGERRALDLVGGRRGAPEEPLGEANHFTHGPSWQA